MACCQYVPNTSIVSIKLLRPKNCCFVNLTSIEEAQRVLAGLNGALIHGQSVRTNWGKEFPVAPAPPMPHMPHMGPHVPLPVALPVIDPEQFKIIDKLAEFVANKGNEGMAFESMVKERERHNNKFAFLFGGPLYDYYQLKLAELRALSLPHHALLPAMPGLGPAAHGLAPLTHTPHEHESALQHLLREFSASKQSGAACQWLMNNSAALSESLNVIRNEIERAPDEEHALNYVYLISDLLQQSLKRRSLTDPTALDDISQHVLQALPALLTALARHSTHLDTTVARVQRIFKQWESRAVFDSSVMLALEQHLHDAAKPPPPWVTQHPSPAPLLPSPTLFVVSAPPPPQIDPNINMPPGIIVALHKHYRPAPYTPLNVALQPIPPMPAPDPNIPSLIEQFVASL